MVDRMKQLQRNTVTNADVIDGALVLKRYDGSRLSVDSGTSGIVPEDDADGQRIAIKDHAGDIKGYIGWSEGGGGLAFWIGDATGAADYDVPMFFLYPDPGGWFLANTAENVIFQANGDSAELKAPTVTIGSNSGSTVVRGAVSIPAGLGDDLYFNAPAGPILVSPDGSGFRLKVANDGTLSTEPQ